MFEKIAQQFGYTFNLQIARSQCIKYINIHTIITTIIVLAAIIVIIAGLIYIKKNIKRK